MNKLLRIKRELYYIEVSLFGIRGTNFALYNVVKHQQRGLIRVHLEACSDHVMMLEPQRRHNKERSHLDANKTICYFYWFIAFGTTFGQCR